MSDPITQAALNPAGEMGGAERFLAGVGKTLTDLGHGAQQMIGLGPSRAEVDERRDRDVSLMATPEGFGGSLAGGIAATLPAITAGSSLPAVAGAGALYGALQPLGADESRLVNTAVGGATAGAMKYGLDKAAPWLTQHIQAQRAAVAPANARAQELARVLREGREAGLRVSPSEVHPSFANRLIESVGGKAATGHQATRVNQDVVYATAQRHAGLPSNVALTKENLSVAREAAAGPYRQVAQMSDEAATMLREWKLRNALSNRYWQEYARNKTVTSYEAYEANKRAANIALDQLDEMAMARPETVNLIDALKAARVQIAKIHTVEKALKGSSVDPRSFAKGAERGEPISGELGMMARFAQDFPSAMRAPQAVGGPTNQLMPWLGAGTGGLIGTGLAGPAGAGIGGLAGGVTVAAAPALARALILSRPYQARMAQPALQAPSHASRLAAALLQRPEVRAALPAGAAMYAGGQ